MPSSLRYAVFLLLALAATALGLSAQRAPAVYDLTGRFSGSISVGGDTIVFLDPGMIRSSVGCGGGSITVCYWSSDPVGGPPRKVEVRGVPRPGQGTASFVSEFRDMLETSMVWYPPDAPPPLGFSSAPATDNQGTMELTWKHDPDGPGPLQVILVRAAVERQAGDDAASQARRLKAEADALMAIYPPNVPITK